MKIQYPFDSKGRSPERQAFLDAMAKAVFKATANQGALPAPEITCTPTVAAVEPLKTRLDEPKGHTPGPWKWVGSHGQPDARIYLSTPNGYANWQPGDAESDANAKLIAAAPCLIDALENILADCETAAGRNTAADWDFAVTRAIEYARAAIAETEPKTTAHALSTLSAPPASTTG